MTPAELDLVIYQGATFRRTFTWKTGSSLTPVNLTGFTARMQVRKKITDPDPVISLTTSNGGIVLTNPTAGEFEIVITDTLTSALTIKTGVYDLEFVAPGGDVSRLMQGAVEVSPEVTRS